MTAQRFQQQSEQQARQREQQINAAMVAARTSPEQQWTRAQNVQPQPEQRAEVRQTHVEAAEPVQHNAPPAAAPVQVQSESHDSNRGSGNDKKDH